MQLSGFTKYFISILRSKKRRQEVPAEPPGVVQDTVIALLIAVQFKPESEIFSVTLCAYPLVPVVKDVKCCSNFNHRNT